MQSCLVYGRETRKHQQPSVLAKSPSEAAKQLPSYPGNAVHLLCLPWKPPALPRSTRLAEPPAPHATIATRHRPSIAAAAVHRQQRGIASRTVLPSSEESPRQALREVTVPHNGEGELCHLPGVTPP